MELWRIFRQFEMFRDFLFQRTATGFYEYRIKSQIWAPQSLILESIGSFHFLFHDNFPMKKNEFSHFKYLSCQNVMSTSWMIFHLQKFWVIDQCQLKYIIWYEFLQYDDKSVSGSHWKDTYYPELVFIHLFMI